MKNSFLFFVLGLGIGLSSAAWAAEVQSSAQGQTNIALTA